MDILPGEWLSPRFGDQSLSEFVVFCHIHGKDCAAPHTARPIGLGQTSQADCSTAETNYIPCPADASALVQCTP